jgi:hypothetical protein
MNINQALKPPKLGGTVGGGMRAEAWQSARRAPQVHPSPVPSKPPIPGAAAKLEVPNLRYPPLR